jgi:methanogenic corrinoid protein MtbC1
MAFNNKTKKKIDIEKIVRKIKRNLKKEKIDEYLEMINTSDKRNYKAFLIRKKLAYDLITAKEYVHPEQFLPHNPILKKIKQSLLFILKVYTNKQTLFNQSVLNLVEDLYEYLKLLEKNTFSK